MKNYKNRLALFFITLLAFSCVTDEDKLYSLDYIQAPSNVDAVFNITQDNSGLVTITPNAEGATSYTIDFGDGVSEDLAVAESASHIYAEGVYQVEVTAHGITGLTTEATKQLNVAFKAPENLSVVVENDQLISKKVNITATADYATVFEIYFGETEDEEPTLALPGEMASHTYAEAGDYQVFMKAKSAAIATLDTTFTVTAIEIVSPVLAAPTPPARNAADVISIFSDAYTNITVNEWNPGWGQTTTLTTVEVAGNPTLLYGALNYTGIVTDYNNPTDVTAMTHVHFDYWTPDATELSLKLVNTSLDPVQEDLEMVPSITQGSWVSVDMALSEFALDLSGVTQLLFGSSGATVYIDNLYFYSATASAPTEAAPVPTADAANVISIFSDAYTNITVNEWNPGWGQTTTLTTPQINGDNTLLYEALNYTGIVTDYGNPTDVSEMTHIHFDYWTNDATALSLKLVNTTYDPVQEHIEALSSISYGSWISVDIPLENYSIDLSGVTQLLFESSNSKVYIDNIYFYKQGTANAPTTAAPAPTANSGDVISIFSDAYTNITVNEWNPGWGQTTTLTTLQINGDNTLHYEALNYTGIVTDYGNPTDLSAKTYVHFDYWTNDATALSLKLVNTTYDPVQEHIEGLSSISYGNWISVDIPLVNYTIDLSGVTQLLFESSSANVYIDNIYFY
ncbi:hypothetical protein [Mangrovibacterium marinum]|uniref:PKD/Chitinase domain-containing protein n=1 Tax=Mangrovibacterium marinum TaxID=1639118 RepID=A0A2T5C2R2_9BACT|nr:hypothetical protein [Mangrovibacterium marinum]PTN09011.1 hypothetical protein C8N47_106110 [Mangrovibacterium marinum]